MSDETEQEDNEDFKTVLKGISKKIRITKVTATRSLRGNNGQTFSGFTARTDSLEDESGMVLDASDHPGGGMGLRDARLAYYLLAMQADLASTNAACAAGDISPHVRDEMIRQTKRNFALLLRQSMREDSNE